MREVSGLVRGNLPGGLEDAWLSHVPYVNEGTNDLKRSQFNLVLIQAPESIGFAVRVLCHGRDLSKLDMTNPDSDHEIIEADDRAVTLGSQSFLERYALSTDNDQDEDPVWRHFCPTLIDRLTASAPEDFSFELQDGALCCFVPGSLTDSAAIDGLCEASARVLKEVTSIGAGGGGPSVDAGDRRSKVDEELAKHPFSSPPKAGQVAISRDASWVADGRSPMLGRGTIPNGVSSERGLTKMSRDPLAALLDTRRRHKGPNRQGTCFVPGRLQVGS